MSAAEFFTHLTWPAAFALAAVAFAAAWALVTLFKVVAGYYDEPPSRRSKKP